MAFDHEDHGDEDESAHDLGQERLPVLAEAVVIVSHVIVILTLRVSRGEDGYALGTDSEVTICVRVAEGERGDGHAEERADELGCDDKTGECRIFFPFAFVDVDAEGDGGVEVTARDSTENDDDCEEGQGDGQGVARRHQDHVDEYCCADQLVSCHERLFLRTTRDFHLSNKMCDCYLL